jgi:Bardet-Biedl syndrome 4 protein
VFGGEAWCVIPVCPSAAVVFRYLLGKHKAALEVYQEAQRIGINDWEIWHNMGLCYMYLKQYDKSIEAFNNANSMQRHDVTFMQLGKVRSLI